MPDEKGNTTKLDNWSLERVDSKSYEAGGAEIDPKKSHPMVLDINTRDCDFESI